MRTKTYQAKVKAAGDGDPEGTFEALVSVFGNVDAIGDRVVKGAFANSLKTWEESGDPIPVVFSHRWDDLDAHIGKVLEAEETDEGLRVKAQLDLDDPSAAKVHRMLTDRRIREFSFAYDVIDEKEVDGANELRELDVIEVGPTLKGMNPATQLLAAKAADLDDDQVDQIIEVIDAIEGGAKTVRFLQSANDVRARMGMPRVNDPKSGGEMVLVKAGRVLSSKNETKIRNAAELLSEVLAAVESTSDQEEKANLPANPEGPEGVNGEEPTVRSPTDVRLLADIDALDTVPV